MVASAALAGAAHGIKAGEGIGAHSQQSAGGNLQGTGSAQGVASNQGSAQGSIQASSQSTQYTTPQPDPTKVAAGLTSGTTINTKTGLICSVCRCILPFPFAVFLVRRESTSCQVSSQIGASSEKLQSLKACGGASDAGQATTVPPPPSKRVLPEGVTRDKTPEVQGQTKVVATSNVGLINTYCDCGSLLSPDDTSLKHALSSFKATSCHLSFYLHSTDSKNCT